MIYLASNIMKFLKRIFQRKVYVSASEDAIRNVNFKYKRALKELKDYDTGNLKGLDLSSGIKSFQDYFAERS